MDIDQTVKIIVGGVVGGFALIFLVPILITTICIITVVLVCICNKNCPLYSQRERRRRQPRIGVLVTVDGEQDESDKNRSIKYHAIETTQGTVLKLQIIYGIMHSFISIQIRMVIINFVKTHGHQRAIV